MEKSLWKCHLLFRAFPWKMSTCRNSPEKSSPTQKNKHKVSDYSMFTHCSFDATRNNLDCYGGKDCMKMFCNDWKEHLLKIINNEKK